MTTDILKWKNYCLILLFFFLWFNMSTTVEEKIEVTSLKLLFQKSI